jgi:hypothetical protein
MPATEAHFQDLLGRYNQVMVVNLLGTKDSSGESPLWQAYNQALKSLNLPIEMLRLLNFDFHQKVKVAGFEGTGAELSRDIDYEADKFKYCLLDRSKDRVVMKQDGVFRTNCLDCLDR